MDGWLTVWTLAGRQIGGEKADSLESPSTYNSYWEPALAIGSRLNDSTKGAHFIGQLRVERWTSHSLSSRRSFRYQIVPKFVSLTDFASLSDPCSANFFVTAVAACFDSEFDPQKWAEQPV